MANLQSHSVAGPSYRSKTRKNGQPVGFADAFYGFAARIITGLMSIVLVLILNFIWGAINGWIVTSPMLFIDAFVVFLFVFLGEHIRSRSFERTYNIDRVAAREGAFNSVKNTKWNPESGISNYNIEEVENEIAFDKVYLPYTSHVKIFFEVSYSIISLAFLSPLFLVVASIIILENPGPVFNRFDYRLLNGKIIRLTNFRVLKNNPADKSDYTLVGRYIRKASIDSLPLLFDVLMGRVALIGPLSISAYSKFRDNSKLAKHRECMKPSIGSYINLVSSAPTKDKNNPDRMQKSIDSFVLDYERNWTIWRDLLIMAETVRHEVCR